MHRRVIEPELSRLRIGELGDIARIGVAVTHAEREMCVAIRAAHVLVEERLCHKFGDTGVALIGE